MRQIQLHDTGAELSMTHYEDTMCSLQVMHDQYVVASLDVFYKSDDGLPRVVVNSISDFVCALPFVCGGEHFLSCVLYSLLAAFGEDHCSYNQAFRDEEGNAKTQPLFALGF